MQEVQDYITINKASEDEILFHLKTCDKNFVPPLSATVDLQSYANKIRSNAVTFEKWDSYKLAGLVAAYFNDTNNGVGFITNVSVISDWAGKGVASRMMQECISYAKKNNFKTIELEVDKQNISAIHLYNKFDFKKISEKNDKIVMRLKVE